MPQIALTGGAPVPVTYDFPFQSYFDTALLQKALLPQNGTIVGAPAPSGMLTQQIGGVAMQLLPGSMTPIAIDFVLANGVPSSPVFVKPGQIIRPGRFSSFQWGLPFGWLGGGVATLLIAQNAESDFGASASAEVVIHRQRMLIQAPNAGPLTLAPNWPIRFPWPGAISGATGGGPQGQLPVTGVVNPTKVMARLRMGTLGAGGGVTRFIMFNIDEFDRAANYTVPTTGFAGACSIDVQWQPWTQSGISVVNGAPPLEFQVQEIDLTTPIARLGGDNCAVIVVDVTAAGTPLAGNYIDVVRYGGL